MFFPHSKHFHQGFTLLELLVVISIIGILSSVVLISYKGQTEKARLANTMQYAKSIHSELGAYAVGGWSFDNIIGNTVLDDSGNGSNGTIYGAIQVDGVIGKALSFDGVDDYVRINDSLSLSIVGKGLTISAWVKTGATKSHAILHKNGHYSLFLSNDKITYADSITWSYGTIGYYGSVKQGQWTHILVTFDGSSLKFYQDAVLVGEKSRPGSLVDNSNALDIGNYTGNNYYFNGLIDDAHIYKEALTQAQIQQHYAEGLKTHQNLVQAETLQNLP